MTPATPPEADPESMSVASALVAARAELGLSQAALADASGVSRSAIKGYETGRNMPGARELKALCAVLRVTPNALLYGTETPFSGDELDSEAARQTRTFLNEPKSAMHLRTQLMALGALLTIEEATSLLHLVRSLAVARHGPEIVKDALIGAELFTEMAAAFKSESKRVMKEGGEVNVDAMTEGITRVLEANPRKPE
jgi:transcriptional regulator with XRE-family HTH domain